MKQEIDSIRIRIAAATRTWLALNDSHGYKQSTECMHASLLYIYKLNATECICKDPAPITILMLETACSVARIEGLYSKR